MNTPTLEDLLELAHSDASEKAVPLGPTQVAAEHRRAGLRRFAIVQGWKE